MSTQTQNHNAAKAETVAAYLNHILRQPADEWLRLGDEHHQPFLKMTGYCFKDLMSAGLTKQILIRKDPEREKGAEKKVRDGAFPESLDQKVWGIKNTLVTKVSDWETANAKILNQNELLRRRLDLVRKMLTIVSGFKSESTQQPDFFSLFEEHNTFLATITEQPA